MKSENIPSAHGLGASLYPLIILFSSGKCTDFATALRSVQIIPLILVAESKMITFSLLRNIKK